MNTASHWQDFFFSMHYLLKKDDLKPPWLEITSWTVIINFTWLEIWFVLIVPLSWKLVAYKIVYHWCLLKKIVPLSWQAKKWNIGLSHVLFGSTIMVWRVILASKFILFQRIFLSHHLDGLHKCMMTYPKVCT